MFIADPPIRRELWSPEQPATPVVNACVRALAHTGLRWGEARAILVRDCSEVPMPMLSVVRNQPEAWRRHKPQSPGRAAVSRCPTRCCR